ncbi:Ribokinase-like protein [Gongronella butleri]|nr:Ribokinase-like protein [Gongronella butleri]
MESGKLTVVQPNSDVSLPLLVLLSLVMARVLLVGQVYHDTIIYMDRYPEEDSKLRARDTEERRGGNICNTAQVLVQQPHVEPWCLSALGPEDDSRGLESQLAKNGIKTLGIYRETPLPSSYIIQSATGTRTIISCNKTKEIDVDEFIDKVEPLCREKPFEWAHFEGRNIHGAIEQMTWLRQHQPTCTVSIELEKPDRPDIDLMLPHGDVLFFSRLFAETRGFDSAQMFLNAMQARCKQTATLYCTWGEQGAWSISQKDGLLHAAAPRVTAIDTVGAGDTFIAGVIDGWQRGCAPLSILEGACSLASRKVAQVGFNHLRAGCAENPRAE